jgi:diaminopimelate decarboxylase
VTGFFRSDQGALVCDGVPLADLAAAQGTPLYAYSADTIRERYRAIRDAFASYPHALHYALKANSTLAIARLLRGLGAHADANSGGEIAVALRAGFTPHQIVFTGVGKTEEELAYAIDIGVSTINAESKGELDRIDAIARTRSIRARVAIRVNPDIDAKSHPHISTGLRGNKFGVPLEHVAALCRRFAGDHTGVQIVALHIHVGSQITDLEPLRRAAQAVVSLAADLRHDGIPIDHVDLGGGLGIPYEGQPVPGPAEYAGVLLPIVRDSGLHLVLEPGRSIVGPAGALVSRVVDVKPSADGKLFVVLDAGMTELIRPMLYNAYHRIEPVERNGEPDVLCDVVGPLCETSDTLGKDRRLPKPTVGDLIAVLDAGAYGSVMASNYNRRPMPAEVLVDGGTWSMIRRRQTVEDLIALET